MFGTNPIRKARRDDDGMSLTVQAVFSTIQGEGPFAGVPAVFLRLAGCNLRCHFCDTDFESKATEWDVDELTDYINQAANGGADRKIANGLVVITGGEPLRQNIRPLVHRLIDKKNFLVQIETAGTLWVDDLEDFITNDGDLTIVCSPKTGDVHDMVKYWCRDWKYLIQEGQVDPEDGLPNKSTQIPEKDLRLFRPSMETGENTIWLQPCEAYKVGYKMVHYATVDGDVELADQAVTSSVRDEEQSKRNIQLCAELAMRHGYRVSLQLHKFLGLP